MGVVYKFDAAEWLTLKMFKESVAFMKANASAENNYDIAIRKESKQFHDLIQEKAA